MSTRYSRNCHLFSDHLGGLLFNQNHQLIFLSQSQKNSLLLSQDVLVMRDDADCATLVKKALLVSSRTVSLLMPALAVRFFVDQDSVNWKQNMKTSTTMPKLIFARIPWNVLGFTSPKWWPIMLYQLESASIAYVHQNFAAQELVITISNRKWTVVGNS